MYATLFKNKWPFLAFVVLMLVSVQVFIGREGDEGLLARAGQDPARQPVALAPAATDPAASAEASADLDGFYGEGELDAVSDEELIDSAQGFDPSPAQDDGFIEDEEVLPPDPTEELPTESQFSSDDPGQAAGTGTSPE